MSDLKEFFATVSDAVDTKLEALFPFDSSNFDRLESAIRWSLFGGGKRFRPSLVFVSGRAFGAEDKELVGTAAAVEMLHTYSLIHDDLPSMDNDDVRRGRQTCHKKFGEATAILAGDALQARAFEVIAQDTAISSAIKLQLISEFAEAAGKMVVGQQLDLASEGKVVTPDRLREIHSSKTGALITFCVQAGAIIAGTKESRMTGITNYGARLGMLFQISDDILDVTQTTDVLGKTAAKDVAANKATYPSLYGLEGAKELLLNVYENTLLSLESIDVTTDQLAEIAKYVVNRRS